MSKSRRQLVRRRVAAWSSGTARLARRRKRTFSLKTIFSGFLSLILGVLRRILPLLGLAAVASFLYFGTRHLLYTDPLFLITKLDVKTDGQIPRDEIIRISKISPNTNLLSVDLTKAKERLTDDPRIQHAFLQRILPNCLILHIRERRQFIEWRFLDTGETCLLDTEGKILKQGLNARKNLLQVDDFRVGRKPLRNKWRFGETVLLKRIRQAAGEIAREPLLSGRNLTKIKIDRFGDFHFVFDDGSQILMKQSFEENLLLLRRLLPNLNLAKGKSRLIDLRFKDPVITRAAK